MNVRNDAGPGASATASLAIGLLIAAMASASAVAQDPQAGGDSGDSKKGSLLIDSVPADLFVPPVQNLPPAPGRRVIQRLPGWESTSVYHTLYLPTDYHPSKRFPVIVEYAGNGNYRNAMGDISTGLVDGSKLGFGISGGKGAIWVCLPFVSGDVNRVAIQWWGDKPDNDVKPTLDYCKQAVPWICQTYNANRESIVLAGFSRGAIACNFVGLHDDQIASLWCGFVAYSHYDGVRNWPYPGSDREAALRRLARLGNRPQFICHELSGEGRGLSATQSFLTSVEGDFTFVETGFRNHSDAWTLRPSPARKQLRDWFARVVGQPQ